MKKTKEELMTDIEFLINNKISFYLNYNGKDDEHIRIELNSIGLNSDTIINLINKNFNYGNYNFYKLYMFINKRR